jgi:hypothetical protein
MVAWCQLVSTHGGTQPGDSPADHITCVQTLRLAATPHTRPSAATTQRQHLQQQHKISVHVHSRHHADGADSTLVAQGKPVLLPGGFLAATACQGAVLGLAATGMTHHPSCVCSSSRLLTGAGLAYRDSRLTPQRPLPEVLCEGGRLQEAHHTPLTKCSTEPPSMLYSLAILSSFICLPAKMSLQQDQQAYCQQAAATGACCCADAQPVAEWNTAFCARLPPIQKGQPVLTRGPRPGECTLNVINQSINSTSGRLWSHPKKCELLPWQVSVTKT